MVRVVVEAILQLPVQVGHQDARARIEIAREPLGDLERAAVAAAIDGRPRVVGAPRRVGDSGCDEGHGQHGVRPGREPSRGGEQGAQAASRRQRHEQVRRQEEDVRVAHVVGVGERRCDEVAGDEEQRPRASAAPPASPRRRGRGRAGATPNCCVMSNQYIPTRSR